MTRPHDITEADCFAALHKLLPPGKALRGPNTDALLKAIAAEIATLYSQTMAEALAEPMPISADFMLVEWLRLSKTANREALLELLQKKGARTIADIRNIISSTQAQQEIGQTPAFKTGQSKVGDPLGGPTVQLWHGGELIRMKVGDKINRPLEYYPAAAQAQAFAELTLPVHAERQLVSGAYRLLTAADAKTNKIQAETGISLIAAGIDYQTEPGWATLKGAAGSALKTGETINLNDGESALLVAEIEAAATGAQNLLAMSPFVIRTDAAGNIELAADSAATPLVNHTHRGAGAHAVALLVEQSSQSISATAYYFHRDDNARHISQTSAIVRTWNDDVELALGYPNIGAISNPIAGEPAITQSGSITRLGADGSLQFPAANAFITWQAADALALGETRYLTAVITPDPAGVAHIESPGFIIAHIGDDPGDSYPGDSSKHFFILYFDDLGVNGFNGSRFIISVWERWNGNWYQRSPANTGSPILYQTHKTDPKVFNPRKILLGATRVAVQANNFLRLQVAVEQDDGSFNTFAANYGATFDAFRKFIIAAKPNYRFRGNIKDITIRHTTAAFDPATAAAVTALGSLHTNINNRAGWGNTAGGAVGDAALNGKVRKLNLYRFKSGRKPSHNQLWGLLRTL